MSVLCGASGVAVVGEGQSWSCFDRAAAHRRANSIHGKKKAIPARVRLACSIAPLVTMAAAGSSAKEFFWRSPCRVQGGHERLPLCGGTHATWQASKQACGPLWCPLLAPKASTPSRSPSARSRTAFCRSVGNLKKSEKPPVSAPSGYA